MSTPTLVSRSADSTARQRPVQEQLLRELQAAMRDARWQTDAAYQDTVLHRFRVLREGALASALGSDNEWAATVYEAALAAATHCGRWEEVQRSEGPLLESIYPALGAPASARHVRVLVGRALRHALHASADASTRLGVIETLQRAMQVPHLAAEPLLHVALPYLGALTGRRAMTVLLWMRTAPDDGVAALLRPLKPELQRIAAAQICSAFMQLSPGDACRFLNTSDAGAVLDMLRSHKPQARLDPNASTIVITERPPAKSSPAQPVAH